MKYKAIISDIDGTLTTQMRGDNLYPMPSPRVVDAVKKAAEKMPIVFATARSLAANKYLMDYLQLPFPYILQNGALIVDGITKKPLWEKQISHEDLFTIVEYLNKKSFSYVIDEREMSAIQYTKDYQPNNPLNIFVSELTLEESKEVEQDLADLSTVALHRVTSWTPGKWGFNMTNAEASKQHAIVEICNMYGFQTEELIGIGDSYGDFPLLMACGFKVAVGNAIEDLKEIADYIAPSVDEDGVAHVIEKFILNQ